MRIAFETNFAPVHNLRISIREHRVASVEGEDDDDDGDAPVDYPRPAPPGGGSPQEQHHAKNEQPKTDKKYDPSYGRKAQETLHKKTELNRPANDLSTGSSASGARVNQPSKRMSL